MEEMEIRFGLKAADNTGSGFFSLSLSNKAVGKSYTAFSTTRKLLLLILPCTKSQAASRLDVPARVK